VDHTAAL